MRKRISILIVVIVSSCVEQASGADRCSFAAGSEVYSNAFIHPESGDLLGYELAIKQLDASKVEAFLYSYEGAPNDDAIPVSGRLSGKNLSVQGEWVERSVAYPSKEKRMERHMVKIEGVLSSTKFQGVIRIEGIAERESVRLKRVRSIWLCNGQ